MPDGETPQSYLREDLPRRRARSNATAGSRRRSQERLEKELRACREARPLRLLPDLSRDPATGGGGRRRGARHAAAHRTAAGRGRGSSVGSIICYLIGLSHIDPIENNLFLGRFLNEEMASVPDIDLDFPRDIREKLMLRVYEHFGREHVGARRDLPHVPPAQRRARSRQGARPAAGGAGPPGEDQRRLGSAARRRRRDGALSEHYRDKLDAPIWRDLIELSEQIAGFPRHISQHVGGMVISSQPLDRAGAAWSRRPWRVATSASGTRTPSTTRA